MPNQNPNGRNTSRDEIRGEHRSWRPQDDDRSTRDRDRDDDDRHLERSDRDRTERYGGGQSGYGAGRFGDDRSMGPGYRNQSRPQSRYDDRQGMHTDDRFTGRGGEGYWEDRTERTGYSSGYSQGGMGYGGYGGGMPPNVDSQQGFRGNTGGAQFANEYNQGRYPDMYGPNEQYGQGTGGRWANVPQSGLQGEWRGMQQSGYGGYGTGGYGGSGTQGGGFRQQGQQGWGEGMGHRGKGPMGYTRSDDRIREIVCETLSDDDHIDASHIEVVVKNGEVMLTGTVEDRRQKRLAEDVIERLPGVKDVQNQLRIASERQESTRGNPNVNQAVGRTETETSTDKKHRA